MKFDRDFKKALFERHDEHMSRPVSEIFPRPDTSMRRAVCPGCNDEFVWVPNTNSHNRMWCSRKCADKFRHDREAMKRKEGPVPFITCRVCKAVVPGTRMGKIKIFCSVKCKREWYKV